MTYREKKLFEKLATGKHEVTEPEWLSLLDATLRLGVEVRLKSFYYWLALAFISVSAFWTVFTTMNDLFYAAAAFAIIIGSGSLFLRKEGLSPLKARTIMHDDVLYYFEAREQYRKNRKKKK